MPARKTILVSGADLETVHSAIERTGLASRGAQRARRVSKGALALDAAFVDLGADVFRAGPLTRGPWNPDHQHAGPPSALISRAIARAAASEGLTHLARLTVNLFRPAPISDCRIEIVGDYLGRNAGHYSGRLVAGNKEIARPIEKLALGEPAVY